MKQTKKQLLISNIKVGDKVLIDVPKEGTIFAKDLLYEKVLSMSIKDNFIYSKTLYSVDNLTKVGTEGRVFIKRYNMEIIAINPTKKKLNKFIFAYKL